MSKPDMELSKHAQEMLVERNIREEWLWRTIMRLKIDKDNDSLYLRLNESPVIESEEIQPGVIFDFDEDGRIVGIEILSLSSRVESDKLSLFQLETV